MQSIRFKSELFPTYTLPVLSAARLRRSLNKGIPVEDWQLRLQWYETRGAVEIPVAFDFVVPRQFGDRRPVSDLLAPLVLPAEASSSQVKQTLVYALTLSNDVVNMTGDASRAQEALERLLAAVPARHLPVLLELAERDAARVRILKSGWDGAFADRIASLIRSEEIAALRAKPLLWDYLKDALTAHSLISPEAPTLLEVRNLTDEQLSEAWQRSTDGTRLDLVALEEAANRGLPWVIPAAVEVVDLFAGSREPEDVRRFMIGISDCPADYQKGRTWLRKNLARLTWDPARKRWVVPE